MWKSLLQGNQIYGFSLVTGARPRCMHLSLQRVLEVWNKDQQVMSEMTELNRIGISSNTQDNIIDRYTYKIK